MDDAALKVVSFVRATAGRPNCDSCNNRNVDFDVVVGGVDNVGIGIDGVVILFLVLLKFQL